MVEEIPKTRSLPSIKRSYISTSNNLKASTLVVLTSFEKKIVEVVEHGLEEEKDKGSKQNYIHFHCRRH